MEAAAGADDTTAIIRLRDRKRRPTKPLAVMVRSLTEASRYADLNSLERDVLASPENPIARFAPTCSPRAHADIHSEVYADPRGSKGMLGVATRSP